MVNLNDLYLTHTTVPSNKLLGIIAWDYYNILQLIVALRISLNKLSNKAQLICENNFSFE